MITLALLQVLNGMGSWVDFDVSEIARRTRAPLLVISFAAFTVLGLLDTLNISKDLLIQFLELIEALYPRCDSLTYARTWNTGKLGQLNLGLILLRPHLGGEALSQRPVLWP